MKHMAAILLLVAATAAQNAPSTSKSPDRDIPAIAQEANGSVVSIVMSDKEGHPLAQGSGFVISKDGRIVTNYHVIKNGSSAVIKFPDGVFFVVDGVLASDKDRDVAIIKAHGNDFRALTLGDSNRLQVGEEVVAIGSPLSLESTVSNGIVSAIRTVEDEGGKFLQITVPISPGSSGGPLFNMSGKVVGITTSHIKGGENLNFAIPINDVKPMFLARSPRAHALPDEPEAATAEQTTGPSLADTLHWMVKSSAGGLKSHDRGWDFSSYVFTKDYSCQGFVIVTTVQEGNLGVERSMEILDLRKMDPDGISEGHGWLKCKVTNDEKEVTDGTSKAVDADHLKSGQLISDDEIGSLPYALFFVDDDDYRSRLAKAFKARRDPVRRETINLLAT